MYLVWLRRPVARSRCHHRQHKGSSVLHTSATCGRKFYSACKWHSVRQTHACNLNSIYKCYIQSCYVHHEPASNAGDIGKGCRTQACFEAYRGVPQRSVPKSTILHAHGMTKNTMGHCTVRRCRLQSKSVTTGAAYGYDNVLHAFVGKKNISQKGG